MAASGSHASHLYLVEITTGEIQFNKDIKKLGANILQWNPDAPFAFGNGTLKSIHCPPFILLSTIRSINCHNKPLLDCIRVSVNCLGMHNSSSPEGSSGHRQQFLLHFTSAHPEMYETASTFILHKLAGTLSGHLHFYYWKLYLQVRQLHATVLVKLQ